MHFNISPIFFTFKGSLMYSLSILNDSFNILLFSKFVENLSHDLYGYEFDIISSNNSSSIWISMTESTNSCN